MIDSTNNPYPDGRHDQGWEKHKDWVPPGTPDDTPEPKGRPSRRMTHEEILLDSVAKMRAAWGTLAKMQHKMDTMRTAILSIIHDNECLKRERDLLVDIVKIEMDCKDVVFERNGTITLVDDDTDD